MLYTIIITNADNTTATATTNATNAKQAHEYAETIAKSGATIRVYPTTQDNDGNVIVYGLLRGALMVAKKSAEKTLSRDGGTKTQQTIASELISANARCGMSNAEKLGVSYVLDTIAKLSQDSNDIFSCAYNGMFDAMQRGADIVEQYHNGYIEINRYIMAQRSASQKEVSTEYILESGGHLVAINTYIARIIKSGDRYTPIDSNTMDSVTADELGNILANASALLTPRQKEIVSLVTRGYSQRKIMELLHIKTVSTINQHLDNIRKIYAEYIHENAPQFDSIIKIAEINAKKQTHRTDRHAKTEERRKANAEKQRRYRERKKAEKNA